MARTKRRNPPARVAARAASFATVLAVGLAVVAALAPPAADAGCGGVVAAPARGSAAVGRAPLVVGDSTSIYAVPLLARHGVEADAQGCRQFAAGVRVLQTRRAAGSLPAVVVLALGANGPIAVGAVEHALSVLGPRRILLVVTARHSEARNRVLRAAARRHPDRVVLVDWVAASVGHPEWFGADGLHVGRIGAAAYADHIRRALRRFAFVPVRRLRVPRHVAGARDCGVAGRGRGRARRVYLIRGPVTCARARQLAEAPVTRAPVGWTGFDWRRTRIGPWSWVIERDDHHAVVGIVG